MVDAIGEVVLLVRVVSTDTTQTEIADGQGLMDASPGLNQ